MNIFNEMISSNKIKSEDELKKLFRELVKKIHPDTTGIYSNKDKFVKLKSDYDVSVEILNSSKKIQEVQLPKKSKQECIAIFLELLASNFPLDSETKNKNKLYVNRTAELNTAVNYYINDCKDLFIMFEDEMLTLKLNTGMVEQDFNKIKMYLYSFLDYSYSQGFNAKPYLEKEYLTTLAILKRRSMLNSIKFINWLIEDIIEVQNK